MIRFVLAALVAGCTGVPQTPSGSAASEDAATTPLPIMGAFNDDDASAQPMPEQHHHGGDHGGH